MAEAADILESAAHFLFSILNSFTIPKAIGPEWVPGHGLLVVIFVH
jgi:hypothetical protein